MICQNTKMNVSANFHISTTLLVNMICNYWYILLQDYQVTNNQWWRIILGENLASF